MEGTGAMNDQAPTLESRIATALTATGIPSADLGQLLVETSAAITAADETAEVERSKALDPALSPDPKAARAAMEDAAFTRDRLKTLLPRLQTKHREAAYAEALATWQGEAAELRERRLALGTKFGKEFPDLMNPIVNQLWAMRALDKEINALNRRRPDSALALEQITPAFAKYLKVPNPEVGEKYWQNGSAGGYVWPPHEPEHGGQMARMMMANPDAFTDRFLAHEAAKGTYLDERIQPGGARHVRGRHRPRPLTDERSRHRR